MEDEGEMLQTFSLIGNFLESEQDIHFVSKLFFSLRESPETTLFEFKKLSELGCLIIFS